MIGHVCPQRAGCSYLSFAALATRVVAYDIDHGGLLFLSCMLRPHTSDFGASQPGFITRQQFSQNKRQNESKQKCAKREFEIQFAVSFAVATSCSEPE